MAVVRKFQSSSFFFFKSGDNYTIYKRNNINLHRFAGASKEHDIKTTAEEIQSKIQHQEKEKPSTTEI